MAPWAFPVVSARGALFGSRCQCRLRRRWNLKWRTIMSRRLREYRFLTVAVLLGALGTALAKAQDGDVGVAMPFNVSAGLLNTQRLQSDDPGASRFAASFRAVFHPNVQLGERWFF